MKIGIINLERNVVNTALMQISQFHKQQGDSVEWWTPLTDRFFDYVYCSSLFTTTDKLEVPQRAICGGTGYNLNSKLSQAIEACNYDYSIYPDCDYSIVWFSRGCIKQCGYKDRPYCIVREKEGLIRSVQPKALNPNGKYVVIQDNNFFANPEWGGGNATN